jgi:ribose transport system ATP-binding protein
MSELLKIHELTKAFSGVVVVDKINFTFKKGEVVGILGENGAGKSTLLKMICGIYQPSSGDIYFNGNKVELNSPSDAKNLGLCMIPQEFNLINSLTVFENIFLGCELKKGLFLDKKSMRNKASELLTELQSDLSPNAIVAKLSVAQKQMVEIAKALVFDAKILVMDEPSTVLTSNEVEILIDLIEKLKARGVTILFISHKLKEVKRICDRLMILRDGELVAIEDVSKIDEEVMAQKMVGRELNQVFPEKSQAKNEIALEVENLSVSGVIEDINFKLKKGEILGVSGMMGSGRTEMAEALMGLRLKSSGKIKLNDQAIEINSVVDALKNHIAYLSEDRQGTGLILNFDTTSNIALSSMQLHKKFKLQKKKEKEVANQYWEDFNIKASSKKAEVRRFSGGNQQKVYLAKCMDTNPQILILDEPTRGIDVNAKSEIYHFVQTLIKKGLSVIIISSELEEIIGLCNRTLVMREGKISGELEGEHLNEEEIMYAATGAKEAS